MGEKNSNCVIVDQSAFFIQVQDVLQVLVWFEGDSDAIKSESHPCWLPNELG